MADQQVGEIVISKRVVKIGHQTYPLDNISRVQTLRVVWAGKRATSYPLKRIAVIVVLVGLIVGAASALVPGLGLDSDAEQAVRVAAGVIIALAAIRVLWLLILLFYRLLFRRPRYALVIETAGTQFTALSGTDRGEVHRIEHAIVQAIENPPQVPINLRVGGDLVMGDQYKQTGADSKLTVHK